MAINETLRERIDEPIQHGEIERALSTIVGILEETDTKQLAASELCWLYRKKAQCLFMRNEYTNAGIAARQALEHAIESDDRLDRALVLNLLGVIHGELADYERSIEYLELAYEIQREADGDRVGSLLNNLGNIHMLMKSYDRALDYFRRAADTGRERDDCWLVALATRNIGRVLSASGRTEEAIDTHRESVRLFKETGDPIQEFHARIRLAEALEDAGRTEEAERIYRECVTKAQGRKEISWPEKLYGSYGRILAEQGKWHEARRMLSRAIELLGDTEDHENLPTWRALLSHAHELDGDLAGALAEQRSAFDILSRLYDRKTEQRLHETMARFDLHRVIREKEHYRDRNEQLKHALNEVSRLRDELTLRNAELAELATRDSLTGVFNRRRLFSALEAELQRSRRYGHDLSLAMFDLDSFKSINDRFGHVVGDRVLVSVAEILTRSTRTTDAVARYGGEEFVLLMPETALESAIAIGEKLRRAVAENDWSHVSSGLSVTASVGVGILHHGESPQELIHRIDMMLYKAKAEGKDQVVTFDADGGGKRVGRINR